MQLTIEVTEDEIRSAIERKVRVAMADEFNSWGCRDSIQAQVKKAVPEAVTAIINECLADHTALRNQIIDKIEKSMTAKVQAALKLKS